ncbi:efflux RND transporter periplasmic adaptor subunit [Planctomicrobium piriforme]|uniref:Multidrug efflux pump subunit AcrA (Membrane-fusion protein) n=1 Tax=Planctomicrobium piriforme TaxID=1576369 RepID=A0A1I3FY91_9PLAN|nr:efflux RND transporter periplasmic adaptor subunit [Planctomicrobium piriforme]SFI16155.1 Multidrug efflux pump subunit AcrA (membrane-fusion protein) [Planctomicrobium piriforme]
MSELESQPARTPAPTGHSSRVATKGPWLQWLASVSLVAVGLGWLLLAPQHGSPMTAASPPARPSVEATGPGEIVVDMQTPIGKRLSVITIEEQTVSEPQLRVTGSIIASRRPGRGGNADFWQFSTPELLSTFTDRERSAADLDFATAQLTRIRDLARTKEDALQREVERSEKLVQSGTEAARDLALQRTSLMETRISNQRDIYEAETAIKTAHRNLIALGIQLQQAGLDPELLANASTALDIVAAEVPEGRIGIVALGQRCSARFFGLPNTDFIGTVAALSPVLSSERRTLRVLFSLHDPHDELRPGMFAEIGIGTDPRPVIRVPADSVIHIARDDYVLVIEEDKSAISKGNGETNSQRLRFRGSPITVGNAVQGRVEVLQGLKAGEQIAAGAVILLKPTLSSALDLPTAITISQGPPR